MNSFVNLDSQILYELAFIQIGDFISEITYNLSQLKYLNCLYVQELKIELTLAWWVGKSEILLRNFDQYSETLNLIHKSNLMKLELILLINKNGKW